MFTVIELQISPLDPCLFSPVDEHGAVHGLIGVHVDDGLCAGDEFLTGLYSSWKFGTLLVLNVTPTSPSQESNLLKINSSTYSQSKGLHFCH